MYGILILRLHFVAHNLDLAVCGCAYVNIDDTNGSRLSLIYFLSSKVGFMQTRTFIAFRVLFRCFPISQHILRLSTRYVI